MPLDYLSYFGVILRGIHRKVDICQTDYSIHSKLRILLYSDVIDGSFLLLLLFSLFQCVINRSGACNFLLASN